jgi:hypothetical protein
VEAVFANPPAGLTPTAPVLQHVLNAKRAVSVEKKVLLIIATDGAPTNAQGQVDVQGLHYVLANGRNPARFHVQFIACTDDLSAVAYLNKSAVQATASGAYGRARSYEIGALECVS